MHYLSSVYFVNQPLHVSGIFVVHHQEVYCVCVCVCVCIYMTRTTDSQLKSTSCCIYSIPPDDGLKICPKHVEVDWRNKLRINNASSFFLITGMYRNALSTKHKIQLVIVWSTPLFAGLPTSFFPVVKCLKGCILNTIFKYNNNNIYFMQLGCNPVAVVSLHSSSNTYTTSCVVQISVIFFYCCTVQSDICTVHSPTNALFYFKEHIKIYIKIHINIAPTCFGLRPSSGSLHWTWLKLYLC